MAERSRNPRGEGARLREEILQAAVALLDETDDLRVLTLRGIARRASISAPSIYPHFVDLPALVDAIRAHAFEQLRALMAEATEQAPTDDPATALVAAARAYVQFAWDHPARYRLMFAAEGYASNAIEAFTVVESLVRATAEAGIGQSRNPRTDTWMVWAGLHGVATLAKPSRAEHRRLGPLDRPAMLATMVHRLARIDE